MGTISLTEELHNNDEIAATLSKDTLDRDKLDNIVNLIVNEFTIKKPELINDTAAGELPDHALDKQIEQYIDKNNLTISGARRKELIKKVHDYLDGYHILQDLIDDNTITDIKAAAEDNISIKRVVNNKVYREYLDLKFDSEEAFRVFCNYVANRNGGSLNGRNAIQVLTDKSRSKDYILRLDISSSIINSNEKPLLAIRKIPKNKLLPKELVELGMFNQEMLEYFEEKVKAGAIIVLCGEGGSGKTTWMNAFLEVVDSNTHALVAQESEELHSKRKNIFFQRIKKRLGENDTEYSLKDLTKNAMIMDINLIVIGEIKGEEAIYLYNAAYSGNGAWSSIHAPNSKKALEKMVTYMEQGSENLDREVHMEMLSTNDIVIFMKDFKCTEVTEIEGYDKEKREIKYNPVFSYEEGEFKKLNNSCARLQEKVNYYKFKNGVGVN